MVTIKKGNILSCEENVICHQVNCMGVMGAGLARQIANKWHKVFYYYKGFVNHYGIGNSNLLGLVNYAFISTERAVANIFGQLDYGSDESIVYTDYIALKMGFQNVFLFAKEKGYSVAIPYGIGCGLANGNWDTVYKIILDIFDDENDNSVPTYIYTLN